MNRITSLQNIDRLEELIARREPEVLALLPEANRFDRLRREWDALNRRYPDPLTRPPLFGALVGVKDIFNVDGLPTRAGSTLPEELFAGPEAACVTALKAAGALVLGKTVTTEFAYFAPGPTRNPLSAALGEIRTPGGSSSGSAAATAAGFCSLALGTQTIGSIIRPAAFCGVVGYKPTFGRVPSDGMLPLSPSADTIGWFGETVGEVWAVAAVVVPDWRPAEGEKGGKGEGEKGSTPAPLPPYPPAPLLPLSPAVVLGIPDGPYLERASAEGLAHFEETIRRLEAAGIEIRRVPTMADYDDIYRRHNELVAYEAARTHARWFDAYREQYHPKTAELIERGRAISEAGYRRALDGRAQLRDELHGLMDAHGLDLWIAPAAVGAALPGLENTGDPVMALPWTHAGLPAVSLPAGTDAAGWPMSLQVVGRFGEDEALLAATAHLPVGSGYSGRPPAV